MTDPLSGTMTRHEKVIYDLVRVLIVQPNGLGQSALGQDLKQVLRRHQSRERPDAQVIPFAAARPRRRR